MNHGGNKVNTKQPIEYYVLSYVSLQQQVEQLKTTHGVNVEGLKKVQDACEKIKTDALEFYPVSLFEVQVSTVEQ